MQVCNYQRILQPFIITCTSFLTQKHLNYHLKGTTSEKSTELYGDVNERQLCVGDWINWFAVTTLVNWVII